MAIEISGDRPARSERAVVFACDANYARFALFAAAQIAQLNPARDFDICLCAMEAPVVPASLAALGVRCVTVETGATFAAVSFDPRRSAAAYLRLALPAAFAGEYRRILYLDGDVFVQGGGFSALMDLDLGGRAIAAVRDNSQWRTPGRRVDSFQLMRLPATRYFNSGMMLIDVAAFEGEQIMARCLAFGAAHAGKVPHMDQDLLNGVLMGDWAELSPLWNWQYTWASRLFEATEGAHVVHFIGPKKPWTHAEGELPLKFRRAYRAFFAAHYPELPPLGPDGPAPHANRVFWRKSLVKHLLAQRRMADYLARFASDMAVLA